MNVRSCCPHFDGELIDVLAAAGERGFWLVGINERDKIEIMYNDANGYVTSGADVVESLRWYKGTIAELYRRRDDIADRPADIWESWEDNDHHGPCDSIP